MLYMPRIQVTHPPVGGTVSQKFIAAGTCRQANGVQGALTPVLGGPPVFGRTVYFKEQEDHKQSATWLILFKVKDQGDYILEITGISDVGIIPATPQLVKVIQHRFIGIDWPPIVNGGYTLSADEKQYFVTYGSTTALATKAEMQGGTLFSADYVDTSTADELWWATFPPLTTGGYTLVVYDSQPSSAPCDCNVP